MIAGKNILLGVTGDIACGGKLSERAIRQALDLTINNPEDLEAVVF